MLQEKEEATKTVVMPASSSIAESASISFYIKHQRYASTSQVAGRPSQTGSDALSTPKRVPFKNSLVAELVSKHSKTLSSFKKLVTIKK